MIFYEEKYNLFFLLFLFLISFIKNEPIYCTIEKNCIIRNLDKIYDFYCDEKFELLTIFPSNRQKIDSLFLSHMNNCSFSVIILNNIFEIEINSQLFERNAENYEIYNSDVTFIYKKGTKMLEQKFLANLKNLRFVADNRFKRDMSPLIFKDAKIENLEINELINSKTLINYFTFDNEITVVEVNVSIKQLSLSMFNIKLDNSILSPLVFKDVELLLLEDYFSITNSELFHSFNNLKFLDIRIFSLRNFFHEGTSWLEYLNTYPTNKTQAIIVSLIQKIDYTLNYNFIDEYSYPDSDFCLFKDFPHDNRVIFQVFTCFNSCTFYWLTQFSFDITCQHSNVTNCDFDLMKLNCDLSLNVQNVNDTEYNKLYILFDPNHIMKLNDFTLSIIAFPTVCSLGIIFNLLNIIVLKNAKFSKSFNARMYQQMVIKSTINLIICIIFLLRLTIKCIDPISSFCFVSFVNNRLLRHFMLTLAYFVGNSLKTCSNLVHISFVLDRLVLISEKKLDFLKKFSLIDYKLLFLIELVFSFLINSIKIYQFEYDPITSFSLYPRIFTEYFDFKYVYAYFNILCIFITDFLVIILQLYFDFALIVFVKETIVNKKSLISHGFHQRSKNEKLERNTKLMVALSGICLFIFHSPDLCISVFMAFTYKRNRGSYYDYQNLFSFLLINISEVIYFISYMLDFFIYYFFNNVFRLSFKYYVLKFSNKLKTITQVKKV